MLVVLPDGRLTIMALWSLPFLLPRQPRTTRHLRMMMTSMTMMMMKMEMLASSADEIST